MKLSFTTMATPDLDHRAAIALAATIGLQGVDLRWSDHLGEVAPGSGAEELAAVKSDFECAGLEIPGLLCYDSLKNDSEERWDLLRADIELFLSIGSAIGAPLIRIFGGHAKDGESMDVYIQGMADASQ